MTDLALITKDDSDIGFHVTTCTRENLFATVMIDMYGNTAVTADMRSEVQEIVDDLLREGYRGFEDGWIELRTGVADVVSFFVERFQESKREELFADERAGTEYRRANDAVQEHRQLCLALQKALGPAGTAEVSGKLASAPS